MLGVFRSSNLLSKQLTKTRGKNERKEESKESTVGSAWREGSREMPLENPAKSQVSCPVSHSPRPEFIALTSQEVHENHLVLPIVHFPRSSLLWCPPPPTPKVQHTRRCSTPDPNSQSKKLAWSPPLGTHCFRGQSTVFDQGACSIFMPMLGSHEMARAESPPGQVHLAPPCSH